MTKTMAVLAVLAVLVGCGPEETPETLAAAVVESDAGEWTTQLPGFGLACTVVDGGTVCTAP
jgi:hypothetical protein